jgi:hypothetical protein
MKHLFTCIGISLLTLLLSNSSFSQKLSTPSYWQQKVDYKIEVQLNDTLNTLDGFITIDYRNNSPQTLDFIYFHLWPNAYKDQSTPLAKQLLEDGKTSFWYSKAEQRGYINKLDFKLNGGDCKWEYAKDTEEICKVILNKPLRTGESVRITTLFHVKIPETFSRMGHIGQSYQITQWYPKPAVYDKYGWHDFPYLDQGEFYSEFGSFDVTITLPKNYVVGATGDLQDTTEINWMNEKADAEKKVDHYSNLPDLRYPPSATETKTLHYKQTNIHDFGWFADKRYHVRKGEVELPHSKQKVTTWALYTNNQANYWIKAPEYIHDAIYYYSLWVGDYPYKQVTAVDGTISAGSGMEYPNVTVIGEERSPFSLDDVITHEVGHNWFYGMLGTNERDHAWMDEGINSYYEFRYVKTKYPNQRMLNSLSERLSKFLDIYQYKNSYELDLGYQVVARENTDQPIDITSSKYTDLNYGVIVYGKTALVFDYLEAYLGTETFDKVMQKYFTTWQYKHPQPEDVRKVFETETGKDLSWFFDDLLNTTKKVDYKIASVKSKDDSLYIKIKNVNDIVSPVSVSLLKKDSILSTVWIDGFSGSHNIALPKLGASKVQIDPLLQIPEINRKNNTYILNKWAHKFEKMRWQFIGSIENQNRSQVFFAPYFGWNNYDKTQVGFALYSPFIPMRKFSYLIVPAIGTGSKQFIGFARANYNFFPKYLQRFTVGIKGKRFSYLLFPKNLTYNKLEPYVFINFKKKTSRSEFDQSLNLRTVIVWQQWIDPTNANDYNNNISSTQHYYVNEAHYRVERNSTLHPFDINLVVQQGDQFVMAEAEAHFKISYKQKNQGLFIRVFAGGFPVYFKPNSDITAPLPNLYLSNSTTNNYAYWLQKDYMYDENLVERNGRDNYLARQVAISGGGFRSITNFGQTNKFLASLNVNSSIYRYFPLHPFFSLGVVVDDLNKAQFAAEAGLTTVILKDVIEINLPLVTTNNITENQQTMGINKWYQKFTFVLKFQLPKSIDLLRQFAGF